MSDVDGFIMRIGVLERELSAAQAEIARLTRALEEIAKQKHPLEMTPQMAGYSYFEDCYACCVVSARAALNLATEMKP